MFSGVLAVHTDEVRPKAYSYLRFSTPEQMKGDSLRRQMALAREYAARNGLELQDVSYQDLGVSAFRGTNAEAGMLGEFLEAVKLGAVPKGSFLLVESLDRISRDKARRAAKLVERICEEGITVVTLNDGRRYDNELLEDDPMATMWLLVVAMRAHEESATKSKRLRAAWANKRAKAGDVKLTARAPTWLRLSVDRKRFEVIEEKAAVVRRIFEMTASGVGQHQIVKTLNAEGVPTFDRGKQWYRSFVTKLLSSETVIGRYTPNVIEFEGSRKVRRPLEPIEDYYPRIVSDELWSEVRTATARGVATRGKSAASGIVSNLLGGLAKCLTCGGAMTLATKNERDRYLVCVKAKTGAGCQYKAIRYGLVEHAVLEGFEPMAALETLGDERLGKELDAVIAESYAINDRVEELLSSKGPLAAQLRERLTEYNARLVELERRERELRLEIEETLPAIVQKRIEALRAALEETPIDRGKINRLLRQMVKEVVVDWPQGTLRFHWRHGGETDLVFVPPGALGTGRP